MSDNSKAIPTELRGSKIYKRAEKALGRQRLNELMETDSEELKTKMGQAITEQNKRKRDVEKTPEMRRARDVIKTEMAALRDLNKPEKLLVEFANAVIQARQD